MIETGGPSVLTPSIFEISLPVLVCLTRSINVIFEDAHRAKRGATSRNCVSISPFNVDVRLTARAANLIEQFMFRPTAADQDDAVSDTPEIWWSKRSCRAAYVLTFKTFLSCGNL